MRRPIRRDTEADYTPKPPVEPIGGPFAVERDSKAKLAPFRVRDTRTGQLVRTRGYSVTEFRFADEAQLEANRLNRRDLERAAPPSGAHAVQASALPDSLGAGEAFGPRAASATPAAENAPRAAESPRPFAVDERTSNVVDLHAFRQSKREPATEQLARCDAVLKRLRSQVERRGTSDVPLHPIGDPIEARLWSCDAAIARLEARILQRVGSGSIANENVVPLFSDPVTTRLAECRAAVARLETAEQAHRSSEPPIDPLELARLHRSPKRRRSGAAVTRRGTTNG